MVWLLKYKFKWGNEKLYGLVGYILCGIFIIIMLVFWICVIENKVFVGDCIYYFFIYYFIVNILSKRGV